MGSCNDIKKKKKKPFQSLLLKLSLILSLTLTTLAKPSSDITSLVYKGCSKQTYSDPTGLYQQSLSSLLSALVQQSSKYKFFKTSSSSAGSNAQQQPTFNGLFQCRGDLSTSECFACVQKLPSMADNLCGKTAAARVQLYGCYLYYELAGFAQISGLELHYKTCGATTVQGSGFEERRDTAFGVLENGVVSGHGFFTTSYQSVYVLAQCEGELGDSDCAECVKTAVQRSEVECGSSISGQIYLHKCFISYSYYPNGVPRRSSSSSSDGGDSGGGGGGGGPGNGNTGKTVAIILGGAAGVGFLVICMLFARNLLKKHDGYW